MKSCTKAFTLIEVLVSVMILAVVGTGLLQISTNSKHNFAFLKEKSEFDRLASIAFIHNDQKHHHKSMTLFDLLRDDYGNLDDEFRQYLKTIKINYSQEEISSLSPFEGDNDEEESTDPTQTSTMQSLNLRIVYEKISIDQEKKGATYAYKITIPMGGK